MKKLIFSIIIFFAFCGVVNAACGARTSDNTACTASLTPFVCCTGSGTGTCYVDNPPDNTSANVAACVTQATAGDIINVPAGTGSVSWGASAVTTPANTPLNIIGPGATNLTINLTGNNAFVIGAYAGSLASPGTRISGFKFASPLDSKYTAIYAQGQGWRVDHCTYYSNQTQAGSGVVPGIFVWGSGTNTAVQPYGLIDNNTIISGKIIVTGPSNFSNMGTVWSTPINLGSVEAVYVEDNNFSVDTVGNAGSNPPSSHQIMFDMKWGGKLVARYNTTTNIDAMTHGIQANDERGVRKWEVYGNTYASTWSQSDQFFESMSGSGLVYYNQDLSSVSGFTDIALIDLLRVRSSVGEWGYCDGVGAGSLRYDGDATGQAGWLCRDQVGAGQDSFQWVETWDTSSVPTQSQAPAYFWSNPLLNRTLPTAPVFETSAVANYIKPNRDYYWHTASFDGTSGMGCGTLANRPATCTTGVGYWATTQSCTTLTGMVGTFPSTPISGILYMCGATGWADGTTYTPYTYPHPLRGEGDTQSTPILPWVH